MFKIKIDNEEESNEQRKHLCERCRKFFNFDDIRYVIKGPDSKIAMCSKCRNSFKIESSKIKEKASDKIPYICGRCKFKFKFDKNSGAALKCPYCGKNDKIMLDKVSDIDRLIQESE